MFNKNKFFLPTVPEYKRQTQEVKLQSLTPSLFAYKISKFVCFLKILFYVGKAKVK